MVNSGIANLISVVALITMIGGQGFRISDIDRKTSGKTGKDACTLSLALDWDQFEEICPIRQLATLKKQISDAKRMIKNATALEVDFHHALEEEQEIRREMVVRIDSLQTQVVSCQRELTILHAAVANVSQLPVQEEDLNIPLERPIPPPVEISNANYELEMLYLRRNEELERRVKVLESKIKAFENIPLATSCEDIRRWGVFPVKPEGAPAPFDVNCMREWTVIAKRFDGSVNFLRNWADYKHGFGNVSGEFWIGNDNIHYLTTQGKYRLRIDLVDWNGTEYFTMYDLFYVDGEDELYRVHIGNHTGPFNNALYRDDAVSPFNHNLMYFSTYDMDNDQSTAHCAEVYAGGYWYNDCYASNLNGPYCREEEQHSRCMIWWGNQGRMILKSVTWRIKQLSDISRV